MSRKILVCGWFVAALVGRFAVRADEPGGIKGARRLWQNGRYAEALEAYDEAQNRPGKRHPDEGVKVALGRADCLASQGEYEKARVVIEGAIKLRKDRKDNADLLARLADLKFGRGDWEAASAAAAAALEARPDHLAARWVEARVFEAKGESDKALDAWKWFVDRYNADRDNISKDADSLLIVGQASERY